MGGEGEPPSDKETEEMRSRIQNYVRENGQGEYKYALCNVKKH